MTHSNFYLLRLATVAVTAMLSCAWTLRAQAQDQVPADTHGAWVPLPLPTLDTMRGGFVLPSGLQLSFGIERAVFVDGVLIATTRVQIPDVAHMSERQAADLAAATATMIVRNGAGDIISGSNGAGLIIQNTIDGSTIRSQTTIDAGVDTLGIFKALNSSDALRNAIGSSIGP